MKKYKRIYVGGIIILFLVSSFLFGKNFGSKLKEIPKVEIEGDAFALLVDDAPASSLPSVGTYLIEYTCDNNSKLDWNRTTGELSLSKNTTVQENCSLTFKTNPLLSEVKQGSYVAYEGNNGCLRNGTSVTGSSNAENGNSCLGYNANANTDGTKDSGNNTYGYCYSSNYRFYVSGWRVAYTEDSRAYLISAGSPECNTRTSSTANATYISEANTKALKYCNSSYVDGDCSDNSDSWAIGDTDFNKITAQMTNSTGGYLYTSISGATACGGIYSKEVCGYNNDILDNGGYYWFAAASSASSTYDVYWNPLRRYASDFNNADAYGLRPIIRLSSSVYVTGGSGTMNDPYTIGNNSFSINSRAAYATDVYQ